MFPPIEGHEPYPRQLLCTSLVMAMNQSRFFSDALVILLYRFNTLF